jgi:hypothetical protein
MVDANMLRGYCTASIARSMPWQVSHQIRARGAQRGKKNSGPSLKFIRHVSDKGGGEVAIKPTKHNAKSRRTLDFKPLCQVLRDLRLRGLYPNGQVPDRMTLMVAGVKINGRKWSQGMACGFTSSDGSSDMRVGRLDYFCCLDLEGCTEEEGLFLMVREHEVVKRHRGITYIRESPHPIRICFPVQLLTFAMFIVKTPGDRPVQAPHESKKNFKKRMKTAWPSIRGQLCALKVSPTC